VSDPASRGLPEAIRLAEARKRGFLRVPDERDVPAPKPLARPKVKPLAGQLALGQEVDAEPAG
jgi:hypothetical protein